jgi:hypothetical protein
MKSKKKKKNANNIPHEAKVMINPGINNDG